MNKEEKRKQVDQLAKKIKSLKTTLWLLVKNEEFEKAQHTMDKIEDFQKQLLATLIGRKSK